MEIKKLLPPIITDFIRRNKKAVKYKNYEEALAHCTKQGYNNEALCKMIADKTSLYIESFKKRPYILNATTVYLAFAFNYYANKYGKRKITVVDFGGACGIHYYEVRNILPQTILLNWVVVETEAMINSAVAKGLTNYELSYSSKIENSADPVDFIHSSSALQYVPSPYDLLAKLIALNPQMMLFNRMMFNERQDDIVTIQRSFLSANGPGTLPPGYTDKPILYPHTTMSFHKFHSKIISKGYTCLTEFDEGSGRFSLGKEKILGKGLLYVH